MIGIGIGIPFSRPLGGYTGILNLFPNSIGGYSLRLLRSGYTGNAVRVRRSGDNAEFDFGFLASGELDIASLVAFVIAGGGTQNGFVTIWYDQSTAGTNLTQTNPIFQPQIVSSGSIITRAGKPALFAPTILIKMQRAGLNANPLYSFGVYTFGNFVANTGIFGQWSPQEDFVFGLFGIPSKIYGISNNTSGITTNLDTGATNTLNDVRQLSYILAANNTIRRNGTQIGASAAITNVRNGGTFSIFSYQFNSSLADVNSAYSELILYTSDQFANVSAIESNQIAYFGL